LAASRTELRRDGLVALVALLAAAPVLAMPYSPEEWAQLALLRERDLLGALRPFAEVPYFRPLWFLWLKVADLLGLGGGAAHSAVVLAHAGGAVLVRRALAARMGAGAALAGALLLATAPGTASALSWLAAGNKAFTFFFLALGAYGLAVPRGWLATLGFALVSAGGAIACSENGYLTVLLLPLVIASGPPPRRLHLRYAAAAGGIAAALAAVHLCLLSPQATIGDQSRLAELQRAVLGDPLGWLVACADNLGRYFLHGIGLADDAPRAGAYVLLGLAAVAAVWRRLRAPLAGALAVFVVLDFPASFFPGEASRHHAYLPALGAGLVLAMAGLALPARVATAALAVACFLGRGWHRQAEWLRFLTHADQVLASTVEALPEAPLLPEDVVLVNVPHEYRAAFHLRFGRQAKVRSWLYFTFLTTRAQALLPDGLTWPKDSTSIVLEYDGKGIRRTRFAELAARPRAPQAWLLGAIDRFADPALAWAEIVGAQRELTALGRGFESVGEPASPPAGTVAVGAHGILPGPRPGLFWEVEAELAGAGWVVLGWTPLTAIEATQNAWIFQLRPLPWLFTTTVRDLDPPHAERALAVVPVLGFLPAVQLPPGKHRLRVECRPR
jgi:hypothetical protein